MVRATEVDDPAAQSEPRGGVVPRSLTIDAPAGGDIAALRTLALRGLERMYDRERGLFVFRVRRVGPLLVREGHSHRYTAISLIGLAQESQAASSRVLGGTSARAVADRLVDRLDGIQNLGDLALTAWAARACGCATDRVWARVLALGPDTRPHPTVELAWTLSALAVDAGAPVGALRERLSARLCGALAPKSALFPHHIGASTRRGHVSCFADFVYPTMALAQYGALRGDAAAIECAVRSARAMCDKQGDAGQWWWHYDRRTGRLLEGYPVYAVHQDSMAPMALFAVAVAGGVRFDKSIARGLAWLWQAPELEGRSLVDRRAGLVWRKVARREPAKLSRYVQAAMSRVSPRLRAPGLDSIFPPTSVDYEDRPYHLGWVLYAWPAARAAEWAASERS